MTNITQEAVDALTDEQINYINTCPGDEEMLLIQGQDSHDEPDVAEVIVDGD